MKLSIAFLILYASTGQPNQSADDAQAAAKLLQQKWNDFYAEEAARHVIEIGDGPGERLKMRKEAVLHWSNPVRGGDTNGSVFVWTHKGRTEMVGTVFSYLVRGNRDLKHVVHSFHSLSRAPLRVRLDGKLFWLAPEPGIHLKSIPDAPKPAASRALRLAQMRILAGEFKVATELEDVQQDLRLLRQPLCRADEDVETIVDGALFAFVTGTDPELMLVVEALETDAGLVWHYAPARFTDLPLTLRHKGEVVWMQEPIRGGPAAPYRTRRVGIRPASMP